MAAFVSSEAQVGSYFKKFRPSKKWSVGLQISPTHLNGDADDATIGLSYGAHVKYSISQSFGLKLNGDLGTLKGGRIEQDFSGNKADGRWGNTTVQQQDPTGNLFNTGNQAPTQDSYEFTNNFRDLNINAVYTLGNLSFLRPLRKLQMFTFFGIGTIWSDVEGGFSDPADANRYYNKYGDTYFTPVGTPGNLTDATTYYKGRNLTVPFGFGVKRNFGRWFDLGLEWRSHWTRSDALDAFSFPIWRNRFQDFYTLVGLQGSVKLGAKGQESHYDWLNPMETVYSDLEQMRIEIDALTGDDDGDGVANKHDKEENTECDRVYGNGIAMDVDGDGINDCDDAEMFSPCPDVDETGKALDDDGDGVPNCLDQEAGSSGDNVDVNGRSIIIPEPKNACCDCDNVTLPSVMFDNGSTRISPSSYGVLYAIAEKLKGCPDLTISAVGYTANKSGERLAWKRANSIIDHLESNYGVDRSRISTGYAPGSGVEYSTKRIDFNQTGK